MERLVLGYSGGLASSAAIPWLRERCGAEVVAVTLDLGQGGDLERLRERALAAGAARCHVLDVRDDLANQYLLPALQAGALDEERCLLPASLARPLIARTLVDIAGMEQAGTVAHGAAGDESSPTSVDRLVRAVNPVMRVVAPARLWKMSGADLVDYARAHGLPAGPTVATGPAPRVVDRNLWGRAVECAREDSWTEPPADAYVLTRSPAEAPDVPAYVEIELTAGVPTQVNGVAMPLAELIGSLETIAGAHGVGRTDGFEPRADGAIRAMVEVPAAVVLHAAHREIERLVVPPDLVRLLRQLSDVYGDLVSGGRWFTPTREAIDAFVKSVQPRLTGTVRLKLFKGHCQVVGRRWSSALSDQARATYA